MRANADTDEDARKARELGAEGIGLCRTEHMFLAADRLPVVRRMILASTPEEEHAAFEELRKVQKKDFAAILKEMSGLPVTVRLLDPPLHEFLPRVDDLEIEKATKGLSQEDEDLLRAAHEWAEVNPMLGTRGVRLGVVKPGLYAMQVRALMEAADEVSSKGYEHIVEIMIPLTVTREELALARSWVEEVLADINSRPSPKAKKGEKSIKRPKVSIGTMIETPRAALRAGELAEVSDFFSFGTNDLSGVSGGLAGTTELVATGATPRDHVAVGIGDGNLGVIESREDVDDTNGDVLRALGATHLDLADFFTKEFLGGDLLALGGSRRGSTRSSGDVGHRGGGGSSSSVRRGGLGLACLGGLGGFFAHREIYVVVK